MPFRTVSTGRTRKDLHSNKDHKVQHQKDGYRVVQAPRGCHKQWKAYPMAKRVTLSI